MLINVRLGNFGRTATLAEPSLLVPEDGLESLPALAERIRDGGVRSLAIIGSNPVYSAPGDLGFAELLSSVPMRMHAGLHFDETGALCQWHAPLGHALETWSDARAADGQVTLLQPLIRPFFGGRSGHVLMQGLLGDVFSDDRSLVVETWREAWGEAFEERWRAALVKGFIPDSAPAEVTPDPVPASPPAVAAEGEPEGLTVVFRPDPSIWDGSFSNIAWLQELPKPLTKVTWDNVILVSTALSGELGIGTGDDVTLELGGRTVTGPAWVMPGQESRTVTVFLGYGRRPVGRVMEDLGYDAYRIRTSNAPWHASGARLTTAGTKTLLASTQLHFALDGMDMVRFVSPAEARSQPSEPKPKAGQARATTIYPVYPFDSPSWGMSIDTDLCIGCNACVVACVAENNIPMVGKAQVAKGREMHWLRVDRYYEGPPEDPRTVFQPVPCMHCEKAPCEMGCPVNATTHSPDGLNQQVYNRCIGTRTCSSFCPYKVRRFNWFDLTGNDPPEIQAVRNPDVTVRDRGVMEKCTYCVQRIRAAEIQAKIEGRPIRDGEVRTACQQACPTDAIVFGDVTDPDTAVSRRKESARDYSLLEEVNTWPRTTYLSRIDDAPADDGASKG
jgi:molybdopterin-containing oxidoreductase family iron-sulfur binding subunit